MAFQKVGGPAKYFKYSECKKGQKLVEGGTYLGPREGRFGIQHAFKLADGTITVLNSSGHLNYLLENHCEIGQACNVTYADKVMLTKGTFKGKECHNFELEVDDAFTGQTVKHSEAAKRSVTPIDTELEDISM